MRGEKGMDGLKREGRRKGGGGVRGEERGGKRG